MTDTDDTLPDDDAPRSWVGIVLGVWLAGVFVASLAGRFEAGQLPALQRIEHVQLVSGFDVCR